MPLQRNLTDLGHIRLSPELAEEVRLLLLDPLTGRTRYGALIDLCEQLFGNWVESQRLKVVTHPTPLKDMSE